MTTMVAGVSRPGLVEEEKMVTVAVEPEALAAPTTIPARTTASKSMLPRCNIVTLTRRRTAIQALLHGTTSA